MAFAGCHEIGRKRAMSLFKRLFFVGLIGLLALPGVAQAQDFSKQQRADIRRFAANNSLFVLYHEMGHLLFDRLELPVLGREEDAADNVATWTLLNQASDEAFTALSDAAHGWILSGIAYDSGGFESDYAAAHSLDKQRAYQIVCLMVGRDQSAYSEIAAQYDLDHDRRKSCQADYHTVDRSLTRLLADTSASKKSRGTEVVVTYHDAGGSLKAAADAFRSSGIFDTVADEVRTRFSLRDTVRFNARRCGEANAFYDPETVEVIFCYELMQDYMDIYADSLTPAGRKTKPKQ